MTLLKRGSGGLTPTNQPRGACGPTPGLGTHAHSAADGPQTRAQHQRPGAGRLAIPPYEGLAAWESGTARSRAQNLTSLAARYPETARAAPPPRQRDPGTIAMIVLWNGHHYQVRIIPHPHNSHWSLKAVDSMLPATTALPESPTPLLPGQPPDPLTAIVLGTAGTWHPGHALHFLWRWAQRRWPHTRVWSATWRFYLDGRQQLKAIPERTADTPTAPNLCPVFAIHQIRALALGEQLQPAIRSETEAQAAHAALVHEMRVLHQPCAREETTRRLRNHLLPPEGRAMDVTPSSADSAINHEDPGRANLAQKDPSYNPTTRGRTTHSSHACASGTPTGETSTYPTHATYTQRVEASISSPWCRTRRKTKRLPPTSPGRGPRSRTPATRLQQRKGRRHTRTRPFT